MCGWDACRRELCRRMCSLDEAERSIHTIAHHLLILEYLSLRPCRRAAYIRRKSLEKKMYLTPRPVTLRRFQPVPSTDDSL